MSISITIHPILPQDSVWIRPFMIERWGAVEIVSRGRIHFGDRLPGFVARDNDSLAGIITYHIEARQCEIITIDSLISEKGIGSALINSVHQEAKNRGCWRLWLITTNDNLPALRFYQKRGFRLAAIYPNAIEVSRRLKPQIPLIGMDGIPIRDEIELEMRLF